MPCKKMSKDVSIPTFTIQYLMESGQGLTSNKVLPVRLKQFEKNAESVMISGVNTRKDQRGK